LPPTIMISLLAEVVSGSTISSVFIPILLVIQHRQYNSKRPFFSWDTWT
jgi:hypothetical protein